MDNYRNMSEFQISARTSERKTTWFGETWRKHFFTVLWYGTSCKEMRWTILRTGEQNNSTTIKSRNSMHWRPIVQGRRNGICRRIVKHIVPKLFSNACIWHETVNGLWTSLHVLSPNRTDKRLERLISHSHTPHECQTMLSYGKHCTKMQIGTLILLKI